MATFCTYDIGNHIEYKNGQRILYSGAIPTSDPLVTMETVETILNLSIMASEVPLDAPWTAPSAAEWDAQIVTTWMDNNISSRDVCSLSPWRYRLSSPPNCATCPFCFAGYLGPPFG